MLKMMTGWLSDRVTERPIDQVTEWPSDPVTQWPSDQVTKWPSDQVTEWQGASQTIDRMVYFIIIVMKEEEAGQHTS